jgi:hypothetical protein
VRDSHNLEISPLEGSANGWEEYLVGVWLAVGAGVGVALGAATHRIALGLALGIALGAIVDVLALRRRRQR